MSFSLEPLEHVDIDQILEVQSLVYPASFCESADVFRQKLCVIAAQGGHAIAYGHREIQFGLLASYAVAHPWHDLAPPPLHAESWELPTDCNVMHLHDIAVAPTFRGQKLATDLTRRIMDEAQRQGWRKVTLVAVFDSWPFWESFGFQTIGPHRYANQNGFWMQRELESACGVVAT